MTLDNRFTIAKTKGTSLWNEHSEGCFLLSCKIRYSMKIKKQTRKLAAGCSKSSFEIADKADEVSSKHGFEVVDKTDEVSNYTYGKATLTWFEEIFEEYDLVYCKLQFA